MPNAESYASSEQQYSDLFIDDFETGTWAPGLLVAMFVLLVWGLRSEYSDLASVSRDDMQDPSSTGFHKPVFRRAVLCTL